MSQMAEVWIMNFDAWELLSSELLMNELQAAVGKTFRDKGVRPYVRDLKPASHAGERTPLSKEKVGVVVYVGTQKGSGFSPIIVVWSQGIGSNGDLCKRNDIIKLDEHFRPKFKVDWCRFRLSNVTETNAQQTALLIDKNELRPSFGSNASSHRLRNVAVGTRLFGNMYRSEDDETKYFGHRRHYFWDWVMVAAVPLAILLILMLFLSAVFFGCREGQHWRDYKTPQGQLSEYVNLRRTQMRLRMLSNQRQSVDFLDGGTLRTNATPVGKQTVADAALCRGSALELYDNGGTEYSNENLKS